MPPPLPPGTPHRSSSQIPGAVLPSPNDSGLGGPNSGSPSYACRIYADDGLCRLFTSVTACRFASAPWLGTGAFVGPLHAAGYPSEWAPGYLASGTLPGRVPFNPQESTASKACSRPHSAPVYRVAFRASPTCRQGTRDRCWPGAERSPRPEGCRGPYPEPPPLP